MCLSNDECPDGQVCAVGACRAKCSSDKDCTSSGLLCDTSAGHCIDPGSGGAGGAPGAGAGGAGNGGAAGTIGAGGASGSGGANAGGGGNGGGGSNAGGGGNGGGGSNAGGGGNGGGGSNAGGGGNGGDGGNGGGGSGGTPVVDAGTTCGPLIDDMEDGDGYICKGDGRVGRWYTFIVGGGTVSPASTTIPAPPALTPAGRDTGIYGMHIVGSSASGGALGVDLKNDGITYGTYDAGQYNGIRFWALGNVTLQVRVNCASTTSTQYGGTCGLALCNANYATKSLTSSWALYSVPFSTLLGGSYTFSSHNLTNIQFFTSSSSFNFWIDDLSFY
jgi:hypothetical protein